MELIRAENLSKWYDERVCALKTVNLSVEGGEWISVMGPSGSGKTTLLNLVGCLDTPTSGTLRVCDVDITSLDQGGRARFRRENIGLVFQQFHLVPHLTALENVMLAQYFHSIEDECEATKALECVGLGDRLHHLPGHLSGGEQQRVCIVRALINDPKIVLADEPTGNLDRENEENVLEIFRGLHRLGKTVLVVTHNPEIGELGDRVVEMAHGEVVGCRGQKLYIPREF
ncbi:MAG: ABC transporter ATP-binding protein [Euryarchaeota archaeon]|nr:ABC transporter ATP-binding protein [Euryarchaeota archaeon]